MTESFGACASVVTTPTIVAQNAFTNASVSGTYLAIHYPIEVTWQSKDLGLFTPYGAPTMDYKGVIPTSASSASRSSIASRTNSASMSSNSTHRHRSHHALSTGGIAGIAVGIALFVGLVVVLLGFLQRQKRRRKCRDESAGTESVYDVKDRRISEADGTPLNELTGVSRPAEADPSHGISELEGGEAGSKKDTGGEIKDDKHIYM